MPRRGPTLTHLRSHRQRAPRGISPFARPLCVALATALLWASVATQRRAAAAAPSREAQLAAVFLYNFAQFTEWPADAFATSTAPLEMGIVSPDAGVAEALAIAVSGKTVAGRPIVVRRFASAAEVRACHVLYAEGALGNELAPRMEQFRKSAVLTVGNAPAFLDAGGMVRLYTEGNKMRFEVNLPAVEQARLKVSSQLLKVAKVR